MSLYSLFAGKGPNGFGYGSTAADVTEGLSLAGKTILVTGCNSGIGQETMRVLALRGAHVIGAARTEAKTREASAGMSGKVTPVACELAEPASVRACADAVKHPSVAGVTGKYFSDCNEKTPRPNAEDPELARRLWEKTEEIVAKL